MATMNSGNNSNTPATAQVAMPSQKQTVSTAKTVDTQSVLKRSLFFSSNLIILIFMVREYVCYLIFLIWGFEISDFSCFKVFFLEILDFGYLWFYASDVFVI